MRRLLPSTSALAAFEAAALHLNFTRAGEELGLTQSGISRHINSLEQQLGISLFERIGPKLKLTEAGQSYASEISRILTDIETASIDVVRGAKVQNLLRIAVQDSFATTWLAPRLPGFIAQHPEDSLFQIEPVKELPLDATNKIDISILRGHGAWRDCYSYPIIDEMVGVVAAPSLVPENVELLPDQIDDYTLLQASHRHDSWLQWLEAKNVQHIGHLQGPRFGQSSLLIEAAVSGLGLAVLPMVLIEKQLAEGTLRLVAGPPVPTGFGFFIVMQQRNTHREQVLRFRDWVIRETRSYRKK